jgi:hypothetical protein
MARLAKLGLCALGLSAALPAATDHRELAICWSCSEHGSRSWWRAFRLAACDCAEGWSGPCCNLADDHHDGAFALKRIANDKVAEELAWATDESDMPTSLHGIFWMDQRGVSNLTQASDPSYRHVGSTAADELLVTFGEAEWDPKTRCAGRVPVFGGKHGHWTFMDQGAGAPDGTPASDIFETSLSSRLNLKFCFRDHTMETIDIHSYIKASSLVSNWFSLPETFDGYVEIPSWILHLYMVKKPWGWDRVTTVLDVKQLRLLASVLPKGLLEWLDLEPYATAHYPVFPIIDGAGRKTEHWEAYLSWANDPSSWRGYNCTNDAPANNFGSASSTFTCPSNNGRGTQLVGILQ